VHHIGQFGNPAHLSGVGVTDWDTLTMYSRCISACTAQTRDSYNGTQDARAPKQPPDWSPGRRFRFRNGSADQLVEARVQPDLTATATVYYVAVKGPVIMGSEMPKPRPTFTTHSPSTTSRSEVPGRTGVAKAVAKRRKTLYGPVKGQQPGVKVTADRGISSRLFRGGGASHRSVIRPP
jgi:hypothetical protein